MSPSWVPAPTNPPMRTRTTTAILPNQPSGRAVGGVGLARGRRASAGWFMERIMAGQRSDNVTNRRASSSTVTSCPTLFRRSPFESSGRWRSPWRDERLAGAPPRRRAMGGDPRVGLAIGALVAAGGRPFARDELAAMFWPEADDEAARGALRRTLSGLRAALVDPRLPGGWAGGLPR